MCKSSTDFIRNYFLQYRLYKTLNVFEKELEDLSPRPKFLQLETIYEQLMYLENENIKIQEEMRQCDFRMKENDRVFLENKKERDVFKMYHVQLTHDKQKSEKEVKKLKDTIENLENEITSLKKKVIKYDRERLNASRELENLKAKATSGTEINALPPLISEGEKEKPEVVPIGVVQQTSIPKTPKKYWRQIKSIRAHINEINQLITDGENYFSFSDDQTWKKYDINLELLQEGTGHEGHVTCGTIYITDQVVLFSADALGIIKVWNTTNAECLHTFRPTKNEIWTISSKKEHLIFGKNYGSSLWDIKTLVNIKDFDGHTAAITHLDFLDNNNYYSCSIDRLLILQDIRQNSPLQTIGHKFPLISGQHFENMLVAADNSGNVFRYDLRFLNDSVVGSSPAKLSQSIDFGKHAVHKCLIQNDQEKDKLGVLYAACDNGYVYP
eukprot:NODE_205_length_12934_cov_1.115933.p3 type:complete len:441 gc:universal NODE_205_length_12934_cov_1.115933:5574-6896(+)